MASALRDTEQGATVFEPLYPKLRPGPGLSPAQVAANQRARICGALVELVAERGYEGVTVRRLSRLAGVSSRTFYECFANVEDCFTATYERLVRDTLRRVREASAADRDRLRATASAVFDGLGQNPKSAQFLLVESPSAGAAVTAKVAAANLALERMIGGELRAARGADRVRPLLAHGVVAAAMRVARVRLLAGNAPEISSQGIGFTNWIEALDTERLPTWGGLAPKLPRGSTSAEPRAMIGDERRILLAAVSKLSTGIGYSNLTVPLIRREAGVSRSSFDRNFEGVSDCFLAAIEVQLEAAAGRAERIAVLAPTWERGMVRAIAGIAAELVREPGLAQLCLVDIMAPGLAGLELRERTISRWAARLRHSAPADARSDELAAEASVAAALAVATYQVNTGPPDRLWKAVPLIALIVLAPAVGPAAATRAIAAEGVPSRIRSLSENI